MAHYRVKQNGETIATYANESSAKAAVAEKRKNGAKGLRVYKVSDKPKDTESGFTDPTQFAGTL